MSKLLQRLRAVWDRLSAREQRLAAGVGVLVALAIIGTSARGAIQHIRELDTEIGRLQDDLVNYAHQIARRRSVEEQYAIVAAQHSSEWTQAEIHDRLRQEIYRLAQKAPPPLNEKGIPVQSTNESGNLVEIPELGQGILSEGGDDYREYKLTFRIPKGELRPVVNFLERLQASPQSLRIDGLEIDRAPLLQEQVRASITITRTIVDGAGTFDATPAAPAPPPADKITLNAADWSCEGCELTEESGGGLGAIRKEGDGPGVLYLDHPLEGGATYDLIVDITSSGPGALLVSDITGSLFPEGAPLNDDGAAYRYHVQFTVPGKAGGKTRLRAPAIRIDEADARVRVLEVNLRKSVG